MTGKIDPAIASCRTLTQSLDQACHRFGDRQALLSKNEDGEYTRATTLSEFMAQARTVAGNLRDLGLGETDRLALWASNCASWNLTDVAAGLNRAASVGIYVNDSFEDVIYKINHSESRYLFTDDAPRLEKILSRIKSSAPSIRNVFFFGDCPLEDPMILPFSSLLSPTATSVEDRVETTQPSDMAKVMYTSGTTGRPKGAIITHGNLLANAVSTTENFEVYEGDVLISYLPNAHIFQAMLDYTTWLSGACLAYSNKFTLRTDLGLLRPNFVPGVPKVFVMMLMGMEQALSAMTQGRQSLFSDQFDKESYAPRLKELVGLDKATYCLSGAAKLEPEIIRVYRDKLDLIINEGYGISEAAGAVSIGHPAAGKIGFCGKAVPRLEIEARDEDGQAVPTGQVGELCVRGPMIFGGYLNNPQATGTALRDGWYHTGDRGLVDDEGFVQVHGRTGNRVKFANGEYYDLEIIADGFLRRCRLIGQAVVAGEQKEYCVAIVCLSEDLLAAQTIAGQLDIEFGNPDDLVYQEQIVARVKQEFDDIREQTRGLHPYERIDKVIYIRPFSADNGEATPTNKTRNRQVLDKYASQIESMYAADEMFRVLRADD